MAFGNPYLSTNPVDEDVLRSQADTYGNNFSNPMNPANMNSGWGIDPSLLTPSYTAPFRPQYSGSSGYGSYGRPGFGSAMYNLSQISPDPAWGNPFMHQQPNIESAAYTPGDAGMWGAQRVAAPVAAMAAAGAMMGGFNRWGVARGAFSAGRNFGRGLGMGMARGFGMGGLAARGISGGLGLAGGIAAGYGLPLLAMQGMMWGAEKTLFNPYSNSRRSAQDLRDNFYGITFNQGVGNPITGGGLGGYASSVMGNQITQQGIGDMTFSAGQYAEGASMVGRAGLMDNVQAGGMTKRIKESMEQVKLIMAVAAMPEMKEAIEQLAKLQQMGASVQGGTFSTASTTMSQIGKMASVAGTTVQRMMNTVGMQGQYLYQANGMTPYLGQLAAANSYSALAAGNRMGLISEAQMARMGGLDGATQASLTGQINVAQTLYNKIGNYNQYLGGGRSNSMIGNLTQFGQGMASDPMGTYGSMMLYGRQMAGRQMQERGTLAVEDQLGQIAQNLPGVMGRDGKIKFERAVPLLMQMGMSEDQIQAFANQRISEMDPETYKMSLAGMDRNTIEQQRQYISQQGIYGGAIGGTIYAARKAGRSITRGISDAVISPITEGLGSFQDTMSKVVDNLWYGSTVADNQGSIEAFLGSGSTQGLKYLNSSDGKNGKIASKINDLARNGNAHAIAYLKAGSPQEKKAALDKLMTSKALGNDTSDTYLKDYDAYKGLGSFLSNLGQSADTPKKSNTYVMVDDYGRTTDLEGAPSDKVADFNENLRKASGLSSGDNMDSLQSMGLAFKLANRIQSGDINSTNIDDLTNSDEDVKRYAKLTGLSGGKLMSQATKSGVTAVEKGLVSLSTSALGVDKSKYKSVDDAIRATADRNGGRVYDTALTNAQNLDPSEALGFGLASQQDAEMRAQMQEKLKSGRIDFSGYQSTMNALDNKKSIDTFDKAVKKFGEIIDRQDNKSTSSWVGGLLSKPSLPGSGNQRDLANAPGNR